MNFSNRIISSLTKLNTNALVAPERTSERVLPMPKIVYLINKKAVKDHVHNLNLRTSKEFLNLFNAYVGQELYKACRVWNGGKKTLDIAVFTAAFGKRME